MDNRYTFTWHPIERILEIALMGMWTVEEVDPYYAALVEYATANITSQFSILTDLRHYPTQRPEVADMHSAKLAEMTADSPVLREAWLVTGVVATMQAKRGATAGHKPINMFTERDEAWAYLTDSTVPSL